MTDLVELFRDGEIELMNQLVAGVSEVANHTDPNREETD